MLIYYYRDFPQLFKSPKMAPTQTHSMEIHNNNSSCNEAYTLEHLFLHRQRTSHDSLFQSPNRGRIPRSKYRQDNSIFLSKRSLNVKSTIHQSQSLQWDQSFNKLIAFALYMRLARSTMK